MGTLDVETEDPIIPVVLSYNELVNMPRSTVFAELCFGIFIEGGYWTGVRLGLVIEKVGVSPKPGIIEFSATDEYSTKLDLTTVKQEDIIIAYEKNGEPLRETTRLVIPSVNGSSINRIKIVIPSNKTEIYIS